MKKTIFITGSTDGIGKLAAIQFAKEGHELILHGRNQEKLDLTILELKSETNNQHIDGYIADFSNLNAVKNLASRLVLKNHKIDVLVNNAGIYKSANPNNKDGLDIRFVVNYLAPYLLTKELTPLLEKSESPRIINLSSAAQSPVSLNALIGKESISEKISYAQSKLALTMWSFNLAKEKQHLNIIAVNPGSLLNTKMVKEAFGEHWSSADKGANIIYKLAISEEYNNSTGKYFDNDKGEVEGFFAPAHIDSFDQDKIDELISITATLV